MTDLAGNQPDMIAQVKQGLATATEQSVNDWDVARFEQILAQETAAIDPAKDSDVATKLALDSLIETIGLVDANKETSLKNFQNFVNEVADKNTNYKALMDEENGTGESIGDKERFGIMMNQMSEIAVTQTKMTQASVQLMSALAKSKWVKSIAQAGVSSVKNTVTRN